MLSSNTRKMQVQVMEPGEQENGVLLSKHCHYNI